MHSVSKTYVSVAGVSSDKNAFLITIAIKNYVTVRDNGFTVQSQVFA
jgi:hypothetical protein